MEILAKPPLSTWPSAAVKVAHKSVQSSRSSNTKPSGNISSMPETRDYGKMMLRRRGCWLDKYKAVRGVPDLCSYCLVTEITNENCLYASASLYLCISHQAAHPHICSRTE